MVARWCVPEQRERFLELTVCAAEIGDVVDDHERHRREELRRTHLEPFLLGNGGNGGELERAQAPPPQERVTLPEAAVASNGLFFDRLQRERAQRRQRFRVDGRQVGTCAASERPREALGEDRNEQAFEPQPEARMLLARDANAVLG